MEPYAKFTLKDYKLLHNVIHTTDIPREFANLKKRRRKNGTIDKHLPFLRERLVTNTALCILRILLYSILTLAIIFTEKENEAQVCKQII